MNKYNILYVTTNIALDERINIGIFLELENETKFRYSRNKLKVVKLLVPKNVYKFIKMQLNSLETCYAITPQARALKYDINNNNLLAVSKPRTIDSDDYDVLFKKFIENE